jgi:prophage regulatory protein
MSDPDDVKGRRFISKPAVLEIADFSSATLDRKVRNGTFPAPVRTSENRVAWRLSDINCWLDDPAAWLARAKDSVAVKNWQRPRRR